MKLDRITIYLILLAGFSLFFGTANPILHIPLISLGYPASLYLLAKRADTTKEAIFAGWLAGVLASTLCVYWLVIPVHVYGYFPFLLALPIPLVFGFIHGLYAALFCFIIFRAKRCEAPEWLLILFTFFAWYFVEWVRSWFLTGFTWLNLAAANAAFPYLIQAVTLIGAQGLSALYAMIGCAYVAKNRVIRITGFTLSSLVILFGYLHTQEKLEEHNIDTTYYALIQGNLLPEDKWNTQLQEDSLNKYLRLSEKAIKLAQKTNVDLSFIVFPETALPFFLQEDKYLSTIIKNFVDIHNIPILTGAVSYRREFKNDYIHTDIYNSIFLVSPSNSEEIFDPIEVIYSKQHLLPFGEYIPSFLDYPIFQIFFAGIGAFTPANNQDILEYDRHKIGMLICYEAIFSYLAQDAVAKGAEVLINVSNDAWYGYSSAAKQHFDLSVLRAVEQDRYMLRSTNTGITTVINPYGQVAKSADLFTDAIGIKEVGYRNTKTIYHRIEPFIAYCINLLFFVFLYIFNLYAKKRKNK